MELHNVVVLKHDYIKDVEFDTTGQPVFSCCGVVFCIVLTI